ncbi:MAG: GNAT family N-acetyltransferase [Henriciella sp.]|nr:GNAT family N-acetyltransferase [Henriciella sp.]
MTPDNITIRRAAPGDEYALGAIGAATFMESFPEIIDGKAIIAHSRNQHTPEIYRTYLTGDDPRYACWIAEYTATGAPVGYAVNCPPNLPVEVHPGDVELKRIYVFSRFHGSGAGKQLNALASAHARALNAPRLLLGTYENNHRAVAFYKREGFTQIGTRQFQVGDELYDDIIMAMRLGR